MPGQRDPFASALQLLVEHDFLVSVDSAADLTVRHPSWPTPRSVAVRTRAVPPTPSSIRGDLARWRHEHGADQGALLYLVPRMTDSLRRMAESNVGIDVIAVEAGEAILQGRSVSGQQQPVIQRPAQRRRPWVRLALIRSLLRTAEPRSQTALAWECGGTQAAVSAALSLLAGVVKRTPEGWIAADPGGLWDRFLTEYPGPGGLTTWWYGIETAVRQASDAQRLAEGAGVEAWLAGDVAADWWAPWRRPERAAIYAVRGVDLSRGPFAESDPDRASLRFVVPADPTIWHTARAWQDERPDAAGVRLLDPVLTAWEMQFLPGVDTDEAISVLRQRVLERLQ